jgi:4-amino-4-deoxy-L-arabinose transferase-like glycosyltransferase
MMPRLTANRTIWIAILAVALVARLAVGAWWQSRLDERRQFYFGDSASYWELGRTIARGEPYQYRSPEARIFRTPGYPLLLAGLYWAFPDGPPVMSARALSAVLGTIAVGVAGWWTTQLFDARAGRIAGWVTALYPGSIALGTFVLSEAPFCPLMLGHLAFWGMAWRAASTRRAIAWAGGGGAVAAAAVMMRPSWLLFTPFALVAGLIFAGNRRRQVASGAVMCLALIVCVLPWWIRNAHVAGRFVPTTLQVGASLYDGLNANADGASDMRFVPKIAALERAEQPQAGGEIFEYRLDRRLAGEALGWARGHPGRAAQLAWIKFTRIWNVWPNEPVFRGWFVRLGLLLTYVPLLAVGLVGAWRFTAWGWPYALAWLPAVYLTMLHVVFVGSIRYREPAMMALCVLAAGVLAGSTPGVRPRDGRSAVDPARATR